MENNIEPAPKQDDQKANNESKPKTSINDSTNDINTGSVGFEGNGDNGAAELRYLRKKYGTDSSDKK